MGWTSNTLQAQILHNLGLVVIIISHMKPKNKKIYGYRPGSRSPELTGFPVSLLPSLYWGCVILTICQPSFSGTVWLLSPSTHAGSVQKQEPCSLSTEPEPQEFLPLAQRDRSSSMSGASAIKTEQGWAGEEGGEKPQGSRILSSLQVRACPGQHFFTQLSGEAPFSFC